VGIFPANLAKKLDFIEKKGDLPHSRPRRRSFINTEPSDLGKPGGEFFSEIKHPNKYFIRMFI
jgi:hypothetical protein